MVIKKSLFFIFAFLINLMSWGQIDTKISSDLQSAMIRQTNPNEKYRIIIMMTDKYDQGQMTRQTQKMQKEEKRAYVINELQNFSAASQQNVLSLLTEGARGGLVNDVHSFWLFNGICCEASADIIRTMVQDSHVKGIYLDHCINRLPEDWDDMEAAEPTRGNAWNVNKVNAEEVWALGYTGAGVLIGLIDTGVKYTHTDLANNMWDGGTEYPHHGYDFYNDDNDPIDDNGHGTHCAGTVSSYGTNGTQCGIAKNAKIMALKVLGSNGSGYHYTSWIAEEFAVSHGCDILSMSLGSSDIGPYYIERDILANIMNCGVVAAIAAGNEGDDLSTYPIPGNIGSPGNCPAPWGNPYQTSILDDGRSACVTVGATTESDTKASFSSIGPVTWAEGEYNYYYSDYPYSPDDDSQIGLIKPDVVAPGYRIVSLNYINNTGYSTKNGTSMATPCVAGIMALLLEADPTLNPMEIDSILETTAVPLGGYHSKNNYFGSGRVNALAAVSAILNACNPPTELVGAVDGCTVNLSWTAASDASTYRVYRNGTLIASKVNNTTYTDNDVPAGLNSYFVRNNCANGGSSESSNVVNLEITVNKEMPCPLDLNATINGTDIHLSWAAPTIRHSNLGYATMATSVFSYDPGNLLYFAQRYPQTMLQSYAGMQIDKIYFMPGETDTEYSITIHKGDAMLPGETIYSTSVMPTEATLQEITLPEPIVIDPNEAYWLVIGSEGTMGYDVMDNCPDAFYYRYNDMPVIFSENGYSWTMYLGISDIPYTYNLYRGSETAHRQKIAEGISETSYIDPIYQSGLYEYSVTAASNGYESKPSSTAWHIITNSQTVSGDLSLNPNNRCYITSDGILTVTETLTCLDPSLLVLEDGAQLYCNSANVQATFHKTIAKTTDDTDGWYTIASPMSEPTILHLTDNTYDIFAYDEDADQEEWQNYRVSNFSFEPGHGYLYANSAAEGEDNTDLVMTGTLTPSNTPIEVSLSYAASYEGIRGYNLIGNPYPHNISMSDVKVNGAAITEFYRLSNGNQLERFTSGEILPGESFFIKASTAGQSVVIGGE